MHRLLKRQLVKTLGLRTDCRGDLSEDDAAALIAGFSAERLRAFLLEVSASYEEHDRQSGRLNHALRISTEEAEELMDELRRRERVAVERYRALLDNTTQGLAIVQGGRVRFVNGRLCELTARASADLLGMELVNLVHPDDRARVAAKLPLGGSHGPAFPTLELQLLAGDGSVRWMQSSTAPVEWDGAPATLVLFTDVGKRKAAETALRKSQAMLQHILNTVPLPIFWKDRDSTYLGCNDPFARAAGLTSPACVVGKTDAELPWNEADATAYVADDREVMQSDRPKLHIVETLRRSDGSVLWIDTNKVPVHDSAGDVVGVLGVFDDITERRRAEEALRESEERFKTLADSLPQTVFECDAMATLTYANRAAFGAFGYTPEDLASGFTALGLLRPDDRSRAATSLFTPTPEERSTSRGYVGQRKDGTQFPVEIHASPKVREGRVAGFRGIIVDVSEQKRHEAELLRTQKLESIGILAGGIAHDFNNILTAILGNVSLAQLEHGESPKLRSQMRDIEAACLQARDLTQQLLTFSKGGAPVRRPLSLADLVQGAATFALRGTNVAFDWFADEDLWPVEADDGQLRQVFNNLVINACQAMRAGGRLSVHARNCEKRAASNLDLDAGRYVEVSVHDQGIGIPPEHLPRVFDPYFTTKRKGTGLGLAVAYSVIRNHHGHIGVESSPGEGTTFTILLPAALEAPAEASAPQRGLPTGRGRVLVMDDEPSIRKVAQALLERIGYSAFTARDGAEAIAMVCGAEEHGTPFDVVIMDLTVPGGMGGKEAMAKLRELVPGVKGIVSSGYSADPVMAAYQDYGFSGVVEKPFRAADLGDVLSTVLNADRG